MELESFLLAILIPAFIFIVGLVIIVYKTSHMRAKKVPADDESRIIEILERSDSLTEIVVQNGFMVNPEVSSSCSPPSLMSAKIESIPESKMDEFINSWRDDIAHEYTVRSKRRRSELDFEFIQRRIESIKILYDNENDIISRPTLRRTSFGGVSSIFTEPESSLFRMLSTGKF